MAKYWTNLMVKWVFTNKPEHFLFALRMIFLRKFGVGIGTLSLWWKSNKRWLIIVSKECRDVGRRKRCDTVASRTKTMKGITYGAVNYGKKVLNYWSILEKTCSKDLKNLPSFSSNYLLPEKSKWIYDYWTHAWCR